VNEWLVDQHMGCRAALLRSCEEEHKAGRTRVVFGPGCAVQRVLLGSEFMRLHVTDLPANLSEDKLKQLVAKLCPGSQVGTALA